MISKLSHEFVQWLLEANKRDISKWYMIDNSNVPDKFRNNIWGILDELVSLSIVKNARKYGKSSLQKCDFSFLPIALDYLGDKSIDGKSQAISIILEQKNVKNEFNGPVNNSNVSSGDNTEQKVVNDLKKEEEEKASWLSKNRAWFIPMIVAIIIAIIQIARG